MRLDLKKNQDILNVEHLLSEVQSDSKKYCLFFDIDGTISEFCIDPKKSYISQEILGIIQKYLDIEIPTFAITGRSVNTAYSLFHPLELPVAGTHGLEIYSNPQIIIKSYISPPEFSHLKKDLAAFCLSFPNLLIEYKTHSVALHYRNNPEFGGAAKSIMLELQKKYNFLTLSEGKYVWELVPIDANKGLAIQTLMKHYCLEQFCPIFIGDDITDESGFAVINQHQGISIKVGQGRTQAQFRLENVLAVTRFLALLFQSLKLKNQNQFNQHKEKNDV